MKEKIIIFGGSGFIGYNLIKKLKKYNFKITSVSRKKPPKKKQLKNIEYINCDISIYNDLKRIKSEYSYIINLSGNINHKNKLQTLKIHYLGCRNLINYFNKKKFKLFIQIGSSLEYGNLKSPHIESKKTHPISSYGIAKSKASKYLIENSKKRKFPFLILRLYQVYGPYQKFDRLIPYTIKSAIKNVKFNCTDGSQYRDFLYIDDLTKLFLKILKRKKTKNGIFNVGFGKPEKVKSVIEKIIKIKKKGKPIFGAIKMRKEEAKVYYPDIKKIKSIYKWKPITKIKEGLKKTINFYEKN